MAEHKAEHKKKEQPEENTWQNVLKKASKQKTEPNTTVIVLGDKNNGKGGLIRKLSDRVGSDGNSETAQDYLLDYSYVAVKSKYDETDPDEVCAHMSIWEMDDVEKTKGLLPRFLKANDLDNTAYMITLDLSKPWGVMASLKKWLGVLEEAHKKVMDEIDPKERKKLTGKISRFNQFFVDPSLQGQDASESKNQAAALDLKQPEKNLGVPLLVVGCKGDMIEDVFKAQDGVGDRFEYMSRKLRLLCLEYGATLIFTSIKGDGENVELLQEYLYHRLYNFELKKPAVMVGEEAAGKFGIYIPSGLDTADLINTVQPSKPSWEPDAGFDVVFKAPVTEEKQAKKVTMEVKAEDNELFFKTLKFSSDQAKRPGQSPLVEKKKPGMAALAGKPSGVDVALRSKSVMQTIKSGASPGKGAGRPGSKDHHAVKDFFRQLLSNTSDRPKSSSLSRQQAKQAMESIKANKADK